MTQTWQYEIYLPHCYYMLQEWEIIYVSYLWADVDGWHDDVIVVHSHSIMSHDRGRLNPLWSHQNVLTHFSVEVWTHESFREGRNLNFQEKPEYPVSQTRWFSFDRLSLRRWRTPAIEIWSTSTQAASGRGKARTVANSGDSGGGDE
jgi:hypothetical protein